MIFGQNLQKRSEIEKSEHHHKMLHIQIALGTKFCLKMTLLNFWTKSTQKGYFRSKKKKEKKKENYHRIPHIRINQGSKFQLQETFLIFKTNVTSGQKQKNKHHQ